ncbi:C2 domain-containing protein At1g53590-like, partial [Tripterygium wilfordii]|uniref:C2 domain-containing protein At1g53590-like n=1 Tax=Tripterygium wilfordii TaxID=458696 RepID=UPI0018F8125B
MDITEVSILHHAGIVLLALWLLSLFNRCHPIAYFFSFIYLYLVHERYVMRLRRKLQYEERKQANRRRVLTDSETVRWLNHVVEKMWPICMEQIASQKILLPIIPWFLEKYKPWTAKKAVVQHLYLGRNPPVFTEMRVLRSTGDDHLVLELGMNFLTADDMSTILAVQLRKRLGFGIWAKLHLTGMHVEGKVLVGVKFLREWPFLGRLRICFSEPPYFQMTVKPIFTHGLDVTELPGIAGWLDKLLSIAFEQTLVEPNMMVVDLEKFISPQAHDSWFSVDEKEPVAYAIVEVIEASDMKPSDLNGLADPYVKGQVGPYRFKTKVQKKTLAPKWLEEFKIPICTWESTNVLAIEVCDKDHFVDDTLGDCSVNISDLRDGQRHDMWLSLQSIKMGRLHLCDNRGISDPYDKEMLNKEDAKNSFSSETAHTASFSSISSDKAPRVPDNFEPINIEGQNETGIWVHQPGSEVAQTWEPRKGKSRLGEAIGGSNPFASGSINNDSSSGDENREGKNLARSLKRRFRKMSAVFNRSPRKEDCSGSLGEPVDSSRTNLKAVNEKEIGVKFIVEETLLGPASGKTLKEGSTSGDGSGPESPSRGHMKDMAKSILKHAGKGARNIRHVLSRKGSTKFRDDTSNVTVED